MQVELIQNIRAFDGEQRKYKHFSETLQCDMIFSLYLPSNPDDKELPLIWWLSGLTCTDDNFSQKSGFQRLADKHQVAVIIPDTSPRGANIPDDEAYDLGQGAGFYLDATAEPWASNYRMYTYITEELSLIAKTLVPRFSGKESIMGHSMGGHGALVLGMKNRDRFKAISAFSPITNPSRVPWGQKAFTAYLGTDTGKWLEWDASELVKTVNEMPILITQGSNDGFYPEQLDETVFLENAATSGAPVAYHKASGYDHSYFFIATFLEEHFAFHLKHLQ